MRKFYCRLCQKENTDVTYITKNGNIEVTFEKAVYGGFHTLVLSISGDILFVEGFNSSDIDFFQRFLKTNRALIEKWVSEDA